jgi:hypothetical protein
MVEGKGRKEGEGGQLATNLWPTGHAWPPLKPYFHKANSFHPSLKFYLFIIIILKFLILYYAMMK